MKKYFNHLKEKSKEGFIKELKVQELEIRNTPDQFSIDRINDHENNYYSYYSGFLNTSGFENLILPHHNHGTQIIEPAGKCITETITKFETIKKLRNTDCFKKSISQMRKFFSVKSKNQHAEFIYLCNNYNVSHPGQYKGDWPNKLFIGNGFHRLLAYALFLKGIGFFTPLFVNYCEVK